MEYPPSSISRKIHRSQTYIDFVFLTLILFFQSVFFSNIYRFQNPDLDAHEPLFAFGATLIWVFKCFMETVVFKFLNFCRMTSGVASIAEVWVTGSLLQWWKFENWVSICLRKFSGRTRCLSGRRHVLWFGGMGPLAYCCSDCVSSMFVLYHPGVVLVDTCWHTCVSVESRVFLWLCCDYYLYHYWLVCYCFISAQLTCRVIVLLHLKYYVSIYYWLAYNCLLIVTFWLWVVTPLLNSVS